MQALYQHIFERTDDIVFVLDPGGVLRLFNPAGRRFFGNDESPAGRALKEFVAPGSLPLVEDMMKTVLDSSGWHGDLLLTGHHKAPTDFSIHAFPQQDGSHNITGIIGIARDVTRRSGQVQQLQAESQERELAIRELEEANFLKSEFLSNASHEVRTPLNSIIGFLGVIRDGLTESREEERELIQSALHSANHLLMLINDILDIAKIEAGRMSVSPAPMELRDVVDEALMLTHVQAEQKHLALSVAGELSVVPAILADYGKLKQVLINVIGNAIKFTEQGSITIRAEAPEDAGVVRILVTDTGIGIEPRDLQMIFEKFSQVDSSFTRTRGGTGLGLSISKQLVELMGGHIQVTSEGIGKGTTVIIEMPQA